MTFVPSDIHILINASLRVATSITYVCQAVKSHTPVLRGNRSGKKLRDADDLGSTAGRQRRWGDMASQSTGKSITHRNFTFKHAKSLVLDA